LRLNYPTIPSNILVKQVTEKKNKEGNIKKTICHVSQVRHSAKLCQKKGSKEKRRNKKIKKKFVVCPLVDTRQSARKAVPRKNVEKKTEETKK
jgi:hypothetical protein